ncbi:MAG TPA: ribonuclease J [Micropepsaceae bacterium]|nr:ribonuclease J [Micropepsaceae bacterium]
MKGKIASDELVYLPLGGAGEIGMNLNLYGFGPPQNRKWLMVDLGIGFGDETIPGVDVVMPDITFIEEHRKNLVGLVLTHAHEDHIGAVPWLWSRLKCPIYATPFTAAVLNAKISDEGSAQDARIRVLQLSARQKIGPFDVELITLTHSIPEPNAVAIRTPLGTILNTGDWKIDPNPLIGVTTDEEALRRLGDEGVLAMTCDSTNVFVPGRSGSEDDVRTALTRVVLECRGRVAVTAFASNVARLESVIAAAHAARRHVALVGRSMFRIVNAARETGYLKSATGLIDAEEARDLPPGRVLYLCTGSQGEPGSALQRIAAGEHRDVSLEKGDTVIFSSRVIPGNEKTVFALQNALAARDVEIITDQDHHVHVSGHPARDELADMYRWVRPRIAIPVHGEMRHLHEHARLARSLQVPETLVAGNGAMIRLAPGRPEQVDQVPSGRMHRDGALVVPAHESGAKARRSMSFAGFVAVTLVIDGRSRLVADPVVVAEGIPEKIVGALTEAATDAAGRLRRLDDDGETAETVRRAVRRAAQSDWGKRPVVRVEVVRI